MSEVYREARASIAPHRRKQAEAELALARWLKGKRGVPAHVLYDRVTGRPLDRELADLETAVDRAHEDVRWCQAVLAAAAEQVKGEPLEAVLARNAEHRGHILTVRDAAREVAG